MAEKDFYHTWYEWSYKGIKPRIIFEELLDVNGKVPDDWKFFCFSGEPGFIEVHRDRFTKHECNIYDLNLSLIPVNIRNKDFEDKIPAPPGFEKMLEIARKLSAGTDFIRVDLYNINGRIIFGELTNYPSAGLQKYEPPIWDTKFGSYWK